MIAKFLARPAVVDWLIRRAMRTPYIHLDGYMMRYWLFNPYPHGSDGAGRRWGDWLPSVRLHHILREDRDRHMHDHPWDFRTFILRGSYAEVRHGDTECFVREPGDTVVLKFGEYHRITGVTPGGVWTLFVSWKKRGTWGFLVNGRKVPWREYLGVRK